MTTYKYERGDLGGVFRLAPTDGYRVIDGAPCWHHAASMTDTSPSQDRYNGDCVSCWHGHAHTADLHNENLARHAARAR